MGEGVAGGLNGEGNGRRQGGDGDEEMVEEYMLSFWSLRNADSIHAAQIAQKFGGIVSGSPIIKKQPDEATFYSTSREKKRLIKEKCKHRTNRHHGSRRSKYLKKVALDADNIQMEISKPMIDFSLPFEKCIKSRNLPYSALGPPYFYYKNVALAPKGVWDTISRFLYVIEPEFVDSKYFCAAMRKSAYIHNLPIENRFPLLTIPRKTIQEVLPTTKKWWPKWDNRTQLNCLQTCTASAKLTERINWVLLSHLGHHFFGVGNTSCIIFLGRGRSGNLFSMGRLWM
ncbi:hypothetical protein KFK09_027123 [Dendrobium nobile]|uniref:SAM-dependent MTase DRM-type domain-containing protein n=1 Tax=Dendrobium nobile TaxID=94219 RepID=A0A8T3A8T9_DENNO|nr:hypothetical protein KFK09_027123 [Dendrobium nobile]